MTLLHPIPPQEVLKFLLSNSPYASYTSSWKGLAVAARLQHVRSGFDSDGP